MRYGRTKEEKRALWDLGMLPVTTVDSEAHADLLLRTACPMNAQGEFVAAELAEDQTLEKLEEFGERLDRIYREIVL